MFEAAGLETQVVVPELNNGERKTGDLTKWATADSMETKRSERTDIMKGNREIITMPRSPLLYIHAPYCRTASFMRS